MHSQTSNTVQCMTWGATFYLLSEAEREIPAYMMTFDDEDLSAVGRKKIAAAQRRDGRG
jgi:hypothetical protein